MTRTPKLSRSVCTLVLTALGLIVLTGCSREGGPAPETEYGNTSIAVILDQADRLESQQRELSTVADSLTDHAQSLRAEADNFHLKEEDLRFRADQLEEQATELRTMIDQWAGTLAGVRNAATTLRAILNDEPVEAPLGSPGPARGELVLYAVIVIVLVLLLLRLRRRRIEREEEERLNAIRQQQAAYSPTPPEAPSDAPAADESDTGPSED